jgi:hypothetical protein
VNNTTDGATGLPVIAATDSLTIVGNGDTIERDSTSDGFRLFDVAAGAALTLENLKLLNGSAGGWGGGAIYTQGALVLNGVTVQNNSASATGGGLYVAGGTVSLNNDTLRNNSAERGGGLYVAAGTVSSNNDTLSANSAVGYGPAGDAAGAGVCVFGGTVTLTNDTLSANTAVSGAGLSGRAGTYAQPNGGNGGPGAPAYGGGICVFGGTVTLNNDTLTGNLAQGGRGGNGGNAYSNYVSSGSPGNGGPGGSGYGGGLYVGPHGTVTLVHDTISSNTAQGGAGGAGGRATHYYFPYGFLHPPVVYIVYGAPGVAGLGEGGGLYIDTLASVCLDAFTLARVTHNSASTSYPDIFGSYTVCP